MPLPRAARWVGPLRPLPDELRALDSLHLDGWMAAPADGLEVLENVQASVAPRELVVRYQVLAAPAVDARCSTSDER